MEFHDERGRFRPGNPGGGRPKGSRSKLGEAFLAELCEDFEAHGKAVIEAVRKTDPAAYLRVVASLVPKELHVEGSVFSDLSDAELDALIKTLLALCYREPEDAEAQAGTDGEPLH